MIAALVPEDPEKLLNRTAAGFMAGAAAAIARQ
jgi:hypothetical protein